MAPGSKQSIDFVSYAGFEAASRCTTMSRVTGVVDSWCGAEQTQSDQLKGREHVLEDRLFDRERHCWF